MADQYTAYTSQNKVPDQHVIKGRHNSHIRSELK